MSNDKESFDSWFNDDDHDLYNFPEEAMKEAWDAGRAEQAKRIQELSDAIHYPSCWDTVTYPTLLDAIKEIGCNPLDCVQGSIDIGNSDE